MATMTDDDIKEIKSQLNNMLKNQTVMMAHLLFLTNQIPSPSSTSSNCKTIATTQGGLAQFSPTVQQLIALQKQHQYSQKIMKPSTSTSFATLTPVPIKRKAELPLEEIGNTGGLKHRRGRPRKPEDGGH
uniref:Uncharacterized protein n=1 Tax=Meloidogyne enterolobii TaxID=390850 RepID=A0A6V7TLV3_MELEN|nr:unnamed protein product [Meloidogyne enterolobii]